MYSSNDDFQGTMEFIGDLMQDYYLCLAANDTAGVIRQLRSMEDMVEKTPPDPVVSEIVLECQKKAAQYLRSLHSDAVRNMIASW